VHSVEIAPSSSLPFFCFSTRPLLSIVALLEEDSLHSSYIRTPSRGEKGIPISIFYTRPSELAGVRHAEKLRRGGGGRIRRALSSAHTHSKATHGIDGGEEGGEEEGTRLEYVREGEGQARG